MPRNTRETARRQNTNRSRSNQTVVSEVSVALNEETDATPVQPVDVELDQTTTTATETNTSPIARPRHTPVDLTVATQPPKARRRTVFLRSTNG